MHRPVEMDETATKDLCKQYEDLCAKQSGLWHDSSAFPNEKHSIGVWLVHYCILSRDEPRSVTSNSQNPQSRVLDGCRRGEMGLTIPSM